MNHTKILATTILTAALMPWAVDKAEAAVVQAIDPLSAAQTVFRNQASGTTNNNLAVANTVFGSSVNRRLSILKQGGGGPGLANIPTVNFGAGLDLSNNTGVNSRLTVRYGSPANAATPTFAATDLTIGGLADRVSLGIILNEVGGTATTMFGVTINGVTVMKPLGFKDSSSPVFPLNFLFTEFGTTVDETKVTSFSFFIDPPANGDISIKFLAVGDANIPEPTTMMGLLAVAGAASILLKKNQRA